MKTPKYIRYFLSAVLLFAVRAVVWGQAVPVSMTITYDNPNTLSVQYPGGYPFVVPATATNVNGQVWGAGGGGGGFYVNYISGNGNFGAAAAGGGGGAYNFVSGVSGTLSIIVGKGGAGGLSTSGIANRGGTGGTSSITAGGTPISAFGGTGGVGITVTVNSNFIYTVANASGNNGQGGQGGSANPSHWGANGALASFVNAGGVRSVTPGYGGGAANGGGNATTNAHIGLNHGAGTFAINPAEQNLILDTDPTIPGGGAPGAWKISNQATTNTIFTFDGLPGANGRVGITFDFTLDAFTPVLKGPTNVCTGDPFTLYVEDPVPYGVIYELWKGSNKLGELNQSNSYSYHIPVAVGAYDSGTYYVIAKYDLSGIAPGATSVVYTGMGTGSMQSNNLVLNVGTSTSNMPKIFWTYNGVCTIDESFDDEIWWWTDGSSTVQGPSLNTPPVLPGTWEPDSTNHIGNYFSNYIEWDDIVSVPVGFDKDDLTWWDASTGGNVLKENGALTTYAGTLSPLPLQPFWQNESHAGETYWVSLEGGVFQCGAPPRLMVRVSIDNTSPFEPLPVCQTFYTISETISWRDVVNDGGVEIDEYQDLLWFHTEEEARDYYLFYHEDIGSLPSLDMYLNNMLNNNPLDLSVLGNYGYWAIRLDQVGELNDCMTPPFPVTVTVVEPVKFWIEEMPSETIVDEICDGSDYELVIQFTGTPPFKIHGVTGFSLPEGISLNTPYNGNETGFDPEGYLRIPMQAAYNGSTSYDYQIYVTDADANSNCFSKNPKNPAPYRSDAHLLVLAKPTVNNITPVSACETSDLPASPIYNLNNGTHITEGWELETGVETETYTGSIDLPLTVADNGKKLRYFVTNQCGTGYSDPVTVNIIEHLEIILASNTVCSGDTLHIQNYNSSLKYTSSDETVAYVDDGIIYSAEGKSGELTITVATTDEICSAFVEITVTPRTQKPTIRWDFDGICLIDEKEIGDPDESTANCGNILTPWNPAGTYFVNHIVWDSLVVNSVGADILIEQIKWYEDEEMTQFVRSGGDPVPCAPDFSTYESDPDGLETYYNHPDNKMANFWQNLPHPKQVYWATITIPDSCESRPVPVIVNISPDGEELPIDSIVGYVQPSGMLNYESYFGFDLGDSHLEWYFTETDAEDGVSIINPAPIALDLTEPVDSIYWIVKADEYGCRSLPTRFRILLVDLPQINFLTPDTLVCAGASTPIRIKITGGISPYQFEILNYNTDRIIRESDCVYNSVDTTFTFTVNPAIPVYYYVSDFSDAITGTGNPLWLSELPPPYGTYFDEVYINVITTKILDVTPLEGPVTGGTFTENDALPTFPVDPNGVVTITGTEFGTVQQVLFGLSPASIVTIEAINRLDADTITCIPPPHPSGLVTVTIITDCGFFSYDTEYLYSSMSITGISPHYAPVTGGDTITIKGSGFMATPGFFDKEVILCGVPAEILYVQGDSLVCITGPSDYARHGSIKIFNGSEWSEFFNRFTYFPVKFIRNGVWSAHTNWDKHTNDSIIPYPNAKIHIMANCLQDIDLAGAVDENNATTFPYRQMMDSITVYPGKAYSIGTGKTLDANVFTLKDDASFLNFGTMNATQQNVEHLLTKGRNWYVSSPLKSGGTLTAVNDRIEWYDETVPGWKSGDGLTIGQGYTIFSASSDIAVKFSGIYNDGDRTSPTLTRTNLADPKLGYNLVGNPFPSYWRWTETAASDANLYSTIWYRTVVKNSIYEFWSYNASGAVAVMPGYEDATPTGSYSLGYVPPMQAFWVRVLDGKSSGTLTFKNDRRAHADHGSNVLKSAGVQNTETRPLLRLAVNNGVRTDETLIYADPAAKKEFDTYDSDKWFINQGVEIFTLPVSSTRELVINGLSEIADSTEVALGLQADEGGAFSFRAKEILNLNELDVFLIDKWRKVEFDLRSGDYNFTASSTRVTDRFSIVFRSISNASDTEIDGDGLLAYTDEDGQMIVVLYLRDQQGSRANVSIFDVAGRKFTEQLVVVGERTILEDIFPKGVYVLRSGKCVTKVVKDK